MKYRQSGKAVTHPKRMLRQLRARLRTEKSIGMQVRLEEDIAELEAELRAPQGGRRHGSTKNGRTVRS